MNEEQPFIERHAGKIMMVNALLTVVLFGLVYHKLETGKYALWNEENEQNK